MAGESAKKLTKTNTSVAVCEWFASRHKRSRNNRKGRDNSCAEKEQTEGIIEQQLEQDQQTVPHGRSVKKKEVEVTTGTELSTILTDFVVMYYHIT